MQKIVFKEIESSDDEMPAMKYKSGFPTPQTVYKPVQAEKVDESIKEDSWRVPKFNMEALMHETPEYTLGQLLELTRSSQSSQQALALQNLRKLGFNNFGSSLGEIVVSTRMALDSDNFTVVNSSIQLISHVLGYGFNELYIWDVLFLTSNGN